MEQKELNALLKAHLKWLRGEDAGIRANLYEADLRGANLREADLSDAQGIPPIACPETGSFIGYKKAYYRDGRTSAPLIITLRVEEDSLRSSATTRKCRCSKATILCAESLSGAPMEKHIDITSCRDRAFVYHVGDTIEIPNFDTYRWNECAPGFHFFITKKEAIDY